MERTDETCYGCRSLATRLADAQATVEALQRERKQAEQKHLQDVAYMRSQYDSIVAMKDEVQAALDAEREKVKGLEDKLDLFLSAEHIMTVSWKGKVADRDKQLADLQAQLSQLQALVRALPEMVGTITAEQISQTGTNWALFDAGGWIATVDGESVAKALKSLLQYRATLDATTPTIEQEIEQIVEEAGNPVWPKGGDGE